MCAEAGPASDLKTGRTVKEKPSAVPGTHELPGILFPLEVPVSETRRKLSSLLEDLFGTCWILSLAAIYKRSTTRALFQTYRPTLKI